MTGAPGTPNNFIVQSANRQILASWDLSPGATSYILQRSLDDISYSTIATISGSPLATSYLDTAVTAGTVYYYKVAASSTIGSINFTGQPVNGNTVSVANVVFTAVTSGAVGTQFNIGGSLAQTITNLAQVINNTIPGEVATTALATQLLLISYSSVTQLSSALTNTTITAFSIGGTSTYTLSQSAIPVPTGEMALSQIRLQAQQRADRVNSKFLTTQEWNTNINKAMFELYDLLITVFEDYYIAPPIQFVAPGNQYIFPLPDGLNTFLDANNPAVTITPPPFYKLLGVDLALNNAVNAYVTVNKFNFIDRNRFVYPNTASTIYGVFNLQYRVLGSNIQFIPTPSGGQALRLWYIPRLKELLQDTDITAQGISGWIEYVIVRAAKYALDKEESDTTKLDQELLFLKGRIEETASNRDAGQPDTISDTNAGGWANGWRGGGGGGSIGGWALAPIGFANNVTNTSLINAILHPQLSLGYVFGLVSVAYLLYLYRSEFGTGVLFSRIRDFIADSTPAFFVHIRKIFTLSTQKQMVGIGTNWIVALMTNAKSVWNRTFKKFIGNSRSNSPFTVKGESRPTAPIETSPPSPAFEICVVEATSTYFTEKSFHNIHDNSLDQTTAGVK